MKVKITGPAVAQLELIDKYYTKEGFVDFGKTLRGEITKAAKLLVINPKIGQIEDNLMHLGQDHRYLVLHSNYKLIYLVQDNILYITDIFDTRQDPSRIKPGS